jgi:hypothetical protein
MSIPRLYKSESEFVEDELEQGDLLQPNEELRGLLDKYHPHYAQNKENKFYVVLTQSCDLAKRQGLCGARYISIAPVRALRVIIQQEFDHKFARPDIGDPFGSAVLKSEVERFLERLINNNESSYFYFFAENSIGVIEPMCAMLALPISLKVEHYESLVRARLSGIQSIFQAKLGWLLGQLYSRVGTPELTSDELRTNVNRITGTLAVWFPNEDFKALKKLLAEHRTANPDQPINKDITEQLIKKIPKKKALVVERVLELATDVELCDSPSPKRYKFRLALEQDPKLARFF